MNQPNESNSSENTCAINQDKKEHCSQTVLIQNRLGLHARAASKLAQLCQQFSAQITLTLEDKEADAASITLFWLPFSPFR